MDGISSSGARNPAVELVMIIINTMYGRNNHLSYGAHNKSACKSGIFAVSADRGQIRRCFCRIYYCTGHLPAKPVILHNCCVNICVEASRTTYSSEVRVGPCILCTECTNCRLFENIPVFIFRAESLRLNRNKRF